MNKLTSQHHLLKNWLERNHISGHFHSIEEVVAGVKYPDGTPMFKLNTNPRIHDKCIKLAKMVKDLNWATDVERYVPIIKDAKGGIKLCESEEELNEFVEKQKRKVEKAYQYANHLKSLKFIDGQVRFINLANRVLDENEMKPVDVYKR